MGLFFGIDRLFDLLNSSVERRMAVLERDVDLGGREVRKVVLCELLERDNHSLAVALGDRLPVCAVLCGAASRVGQQRSERLRKSEPHADNDISKAVVYLGKSEGGVEGGLAERQPDKHAHKEQIADVEDLTLEHVLVESVSHLVREDGADLVLGHSVQQIIKKHDGLQLAKAGEIGVELGGAAGGVHDLDGLDLVAVLGEQGEELVLQFAVLKRREFVAKTAEYRVEEGNEHSYRENDEREEEYYPISRKSVKKRHKAAERERQHELKQK